MAEKPQFILGSGEVVTADNEADRQWLLETGVHEITPQDIHHADLAKQYSDWMYAPEAAAIGAIKGAIPGAQAGALGILAGVSPDAAQAVGNHLEGVEAAWPKTETVGTIAGVVGSALLPGGALVKGAGLLKTAAMAGLQSAAMTSDDLALKHIQSPEGSEKAGAILGTSFLFGAVGGVAMSKVFGGVLGKAGVALEEKGATGVAARNPIGNPGVQARLEQTGGATNVADLADKYGLLTKSPREIKTALQDITKTAEATMNEAKMVSSEVMPVQEHMQFVSALNKELAGTPALEKLGKRVAIDKGQTVEELHRLRVRIDKSITWDNPGSAVNTKLMAGRDLVDGYIKQVLEHNASVNPTLAGDQLERWMTANAEYSAAKGLQDALRHTESTGKSFMGWAGQKMASAGATSGLFGLVGGNPSAVAGGAAMWAGGKAAQGLAEGTVVPQTVKGLGKALQSFDRGIVQTVVARLNGQGAEKLGAMAGAALTDKVYGLSDYTALAATSKWVTENPTRAVPQWAEAMEKAGVPGPVIDSAIPQQIRAAQYLSSVAPKSPWVGATVAPTAWQPTLGQRAAFIDQANAIHNPVKALAAPTPAKLEAIKAVYPIMFQRVVTMTATEAQAQPNMTLPARKWAGAVTGQPATPLSSPQSRLVFMHLDAQSQAQPQGQSHRGPGSPGGNSIFTTQTRLDRMTK